MQDLDATKLNDFQRCPKLFDYRHNHGYNPTGSAIDLDFGLLLGGALELFEKDLFAGVPHEEAHSRAVRFALEGARNEDGSNKFGQFITTWRCKGTTRYVNDKGNAAKCPYSHKGKYFIPPAPDVCSCGSETETVEIWEPTKANKDINQLVELLVGYSDAAPTKALKPIAIDGEPLLEHFWEVPFSHPFLARPVILCGNLDAVKACGDEAFIVDYKSTGKSLDANYWRGFSPNVQVDLYNMAAKRALPYLNIKGVAIEAFSTAGDTSTSFKLFRATDEQKAEMYEDTAIWIAFLQACEDSGIWPRNRSACFSCSFQKVCSRTPQERQTILDQNFTQSFWNPRTRSREPLVRQNAAAENLVPGSSPDIGEFGTKNQQVRQNATVEAASSTPITETPSNRPPEQRGIHPQTL